ncbi:MAG: rhodanese-like domain-containing protein [Magnetococcales bacterium]|nr:rhodanese-like domain-containing protein [Magnetococcales bacterium]
MSWLQNNTMTIFAILLALFFFRNHILSRVLGVGEMSVHDLSTQLASKQPPVLIDVRTQPEFNGGHVKQAILVPLSDLGARMEGLKKNYEGREIAVICRSGNRSLGGSVTLKRAGFDKVYNVSGGMLHWLSQGYPVAK